MYQLKAQIRSHWPAGFLLRGHISRRQLALYLAPVIALIALALVVQSHGQIPYADPHYAGADQARYLSMAMRPFSDEPLTHDPPFCWRILVPLIVHILPASPPIGFWLVTLLSLTGAILALEWFLSGLGLPPAAASAGGFAFVLLGPATGFLLWDYMLVDSLALALLALSLACAVHRRGPLLVATLAVSAATKETALLGAVFAVFWALERRDWALLRWAAAGLVAVVAVLALIRIAVPAASPYGFLTETQKHLSTWSNPLSALVTATVDTWTILLPLAILQIIHPPRLWRSPAAVALLVAANAQLIVAGNITVGRVVVYAFPVVIAASAFEIEYLAGKLGVSRWLLWAPALIFELVWWAYRAGFHTAGQLFDFVTARMLAASTETMLLYGCAVIAVLVVGALFWGQALRWLRREPPRAQQELPEKLFANPYQAGSGVRYAGDGYLASALRLCSHRRRMDPP